MLLVRATTALVKLFMVQLVQHFQSPMEKCKNLSLKRFGEMQIVFELKKKKPL